MVDVKARSRHEVVEGQEFVVNDISKSAQEDKNDCERNQRTKRDAPAEAQFSIMLTKRWTDTLFRLQFNYRSQKCANRDHSAMALASIVLTVCKTLGRPRVIGRS